MIFDNIPQELKMYGLWCVWRLTKNGKIPYDAQTGKLAKSNDKTTFCSYSCAMLSIKDYYMFDTNGNQLGGLGLGLFNGYSAIDIDHCIDDNGQISDMARDIIDHCATYTEKSPSGKGIRIVFKTTTQLDKQIYYIKNSKLGLEIYISNQTNRFVTITGNAINGGEIANVDLTYLLDQYMRRDDKNPLEIALKKDKKFHALWNGVAPGSGQNESELDLALCSKLAYYLKNDKDLINRAFISSPYFASKDAKHKDKWLTRQDYVDSTITTALTSMQVTISNDLTDTGNAHRYVEMFGDRIKYNIDNKAWMVYNGEHWQHDSTLMVKNYAEILADHMKQEAFLAVTETDRKDQLKNANRILSSSGKESMLKETQHLQDVPVTNNDFDNNPWAVNTKSGLVNLKTKEITPHNRMDMCSKICPFEVTYGEPKRWLKFLDEIFNGDKDLIHYVHKYVGYTLTGLTIEQCMFMLLGDGSNGKNVFLKIICDIMGSYAMTANTDMLLEQRNKASGNLSDIARLNKIRLVVASETNPGAKLNEALIKSLTSGIEDIVARFLYGNEFQFRPVFKISTATNYKPIVRGTDNGIWRRMRIIPFNMTFSEEDKDKFLIEKLMTEASDILGWMIDGCLLWQKEGLKEPKAIEDSTKEYRTEMDLIQRWINECCLVGNGNREKSVILFNSFLEYAKLNKEFELSNTLFGRNLSRKFTKKIYGGATYYIGIKIKPYVKEDKYEEIRVDENI